jgi:CMP-N,N'-diacetyllegionaminic acid synthase
MNTLATICARGGSKRTPRKNLKLLAGKPLIAYTIEVALRCKDIEKVVVSTDDEELASVARQYGAEVPFMRPKELATDQAPKWPVLQHVVSFLHNNEGYDPEIVVDLDPTSPLRTEQHVSDCIKMLLNGPKDVEGVVSVYEADKNPYFNMVEYDFSGYLNLIKSLPGGVTRGQDAPKVYSLNASIYAYRTTSLMKTHGLFENKLKAFIMEPWAIDIDTPLDFEIAEFLIQKGYLNQ